MSPAGEPSPEVGSGYSAALLARHLTLCLTRMRLVVREAFEAGAGWGAFAAMTGASAVAIGVETAMREHAAPPTDPHLSAEASDFAILGVGTFCLFVVIAVFLTLVWWCAARLFGAKVTLRTSAIGVAAGALPQVACSAAVIASAFAFRFLLGAEQGVAALNILDYVLILPLFGYGLVGYAAATGFSLGQAFAIQVIGAVGGAALLFGVISVGGLAFDQSLNWLVQLVLG
ncbi:hypothetical protein [Chenggangzhangella methanolivorans]|uniref:Yip1 domain-containing protein n=1 Tax=Chenggangzhangella methanolivorans TaxID=1437009 RepID=A0A9E6R8C9_9HYPH|nr:hypothetical protein [Chenggangzhangella methanolivorans]QZO00083.1 hypothetical protein K6K41_26590 [Chenggangzhangella methanolivorans]